MKDTDPIPTLQKNLARRVASLSDLNARGIVVGELLGRQMLKLLTSSDARKLFHLTVEPDARALRILYRLEHPEGWRKRSGMNREERLEVFLGDLTQVLGKDLPPEGKLDLMLSLACLPFFKGFVSPRAAQEDISSRPSSRVSVLD